jgi:hypothetical protein
MMDRLARLRSRTRLAKALSIYPPAWRILGSLAARWQRPRALDSDPTIDDLMHACLRSCVVASVSRNDSGHVFSKRKNKTRHVPFRGFETRKTTLFFFRSYDQRFRLLTRAVVSLVLGHVHHPATMNTSPRVSTLKSSSTRKTVPSPAGN